MHLKELNEVTETEVKHSNNFYFLMVLSLWFVSIFFSFSMSPVVCS
jgi:hypothetical protein